MAAFILRSRTLIRVKMFRRALKKRKVFIDQVGKLFWKLILENCKGAIKKMRVSHSSRKQLIPYIHIFQCRQVQTNLSQPGTRYASFS